MARWGEGGGETDRGVVVPGFDNESGIQGSKSIVNITVLAYLEGKSIF